MLNLLPLIVDEVRKKKLANQITSDDSLNAPTFQPSTDAFDMVKNTLSSLPERNNNPSMLQKIGGAIVGMGAGLHPLAVVGGQPIGATFDSDASNKATDMFINRPYYEKMDDIDKRVKLQEPLLKSEDNQNQNRLSLFNASENRRIQDRAQDRLAREADERERKNKANEDIQRAKLDQKAKIDDAKQLLAERGEFRSVTDKNGELVLYNTKNPEQIIKTGVNTGDLSDMDKIALRHDAVMKEIAARGDESRETKKTPSASQAVSGSSSMSPTQKMADIQNKTKQAYETHPEWKDYIRINPDTKKYEVFSPKGADNKVLNAIARFIYGEDRVLVRKKDTGEKGYLPRATYEAKKDKYEEIKEDEVKK